MSQQHAQFEEEFRAGPQPHSSYQDGYAEQPLAAYTTPIPPLRTYAPQPQAHAPVQAPVLLAPAQNTRQAGTGVGARVFLAIVSMFFIFGMFVVTLATSRDGQTNAVFALAVIFAFVFTLVVFLINLIVNLVSLKR